MFRWLKKSATGAGPRPEQPQASEQIAPPSGDDSVLLKERGNALFSEGRLEEAADCYRQAIALDPRFAEACNNLGLVLQEQDRPAEAIDMFRKAVALNPDLLAARSNLGFALMNRGEIADAQECFRHMIALAPDHAPALQTLGVIAAQRGDHAEAEKFLRRALVADESNAAAHVNLGHILKSQQRLEEATQEYRRALDLDALLVQAHFSLGNTLRILGRTQEAIDAYGKAIALHPEFIEARLHLAGTLREARRLDEAEACYRDAIRIKPDDAEILFQLGSLLQATGKAGEAENLYRQALRIRPDHAETHNNLGGLFDASGRLAEAAESFRKAAQSRPDYAEAHYNLGVVLYKQGRMGEAEACYRRAAKINPQYAAAHANLGVLLTDQGRMDEAESSYRESLEIKPDDANVHGNLLFNLLYHPGRSREQVFAEHRKYDERICRPLLAQWRPHGNDRNPERCLKVGYVSPDFRSHSVAFFLEPLLREHDRRQVDVHCYADVAKPDATTARLQKLADHWRPVAGMSDDALAEQIREDGIDILVDLAGHTSHNRLPVFARKPAPIQVTWLGYPHSTGLSSMDYRLVDAITDPPGESDAWASETLVRLENGFLCYAAPEEAPLPSPPPCLENSGVTFGSFNNPAKLSSATLDAWAGLLARLPDSRLLVKGKCFADDTGKSAFADKLAQRGVDTARVRMLGMTSGLFDHLATYAQMDIALDTFPYNGTTTTCEALWMGVPVVTLLGDRHAGRVGASLLTHIGMTDLIAASTEDYIGIALALARDPGHLQELRQSLRGRMMASPLCAAPSFARTIEAAYRDMWRQYCAATIKSPATQP